MKTPSGEVVRRYERTTPEAVRDCLNAGMSTRRAAEVLNVSLHSLREACSLFGWKANGHAGPKPNRREIVPLSKRGAHNPWGTHA